MQEIPKAILHSVAGSIVRSPSNGSADEELLERLFSSSSSESKNKFKLRRDRGENRDCPKIGVNRTDSFTFFA